MTMRSRSRRAEFATLLFFAAMLICVAAVWFFRPTILNGIAGVRTIFDLSNTSATALLPASVIASRLADAEAELVRIRYQSLLYQLIADENKRLTELLGLPDIEMSAVGRVIARPPRTHYDTLLVSLPEDHEVHTGDAAFFEGVLLGEVSETYSRGALVLLYSSGGAVHDARVGDPTSIVVLKGLGGGAYSFEIPEAVAVAPGDIVTSESDGRIAMAVVEGVVSSPENTVKKIYARLPVSFAEIRYVIFVKEEVEKTPSEHKKSSGHE